MNKKQLKTLVAMLTDRVVSLERRLKWKDEDYQSLEKEYNALRSEYNAINPDYMQSEINRLTHELHMTKGRTPVRAVRLSEVMTFVADHWWDSNGKIDGIKMIRNLTGCGLKEAKDTYEAYMDPRTL